MGETLRGSSRGPKLEFPFWNVVYCNFWSEVKDSDNIMANPLKLLVLLCNSPDACPNHVINLYPNSPQLLRDRICILQPGRSNPIVGRVIVGSFSAVTRWTGFGTQDDAGGAVDFGPKFEGLGKPAHPEIGDPSGQKHMKKPTLLRTKLSE